MARSIDELIEDMRALEAEFEEAYEQKRDDLHLVVERGRVRFSEAVIAEHRLSKIGLWHYLSHARPMTYLMTPIIYIGFIPLVFLDLYLVFYQAACFPVYRIAKVKRSDYLVLDRGDLPYLNGVQKLGCMYCGYANGLMAFGREIAARTEQYWCPIKHARKILAAHARYPQFFEYGDAETYRAGLERIRGQLETAE